MTTLHTFTPIFKSTHTGSARLERTATYLSRLSDKISHTVSAQYAKWQAHRAAVLADEKMWAFAHQDPRLMAEINAAVAGR